MKNIPVFYSPQQVCDELNFEISPSPYKPRHVVSSWSEKGFPIDIIEPKPVTEKDFCQAHDSGYVRDVLSCKIPNGFGIRLRSLSDSLYWTTGSLLSAARHAIEHGGVAVSPTSGFHHAGYDFGGGFCTFNGLAVTAAVLKNEGKAGRVGILDCDYHYGNGTDHIIARKGFKWLTNLTNSKSYKSNSGPFFDELPGLVQSLSDCDLIIYQAGADAHKDDPLGGFLGTGQLARRDAIVFNEARKLGIPLVWNLAGGYQDPLRKVLDIHDNTMSVCAQIYTGWEPPSGSSHEP